ncbi:tetratricopeptide repeat protein [Dactylosporangium sp. CA-139066]|uniref:tetratricopeptide repeat protein n=1 Tax=Dactylosporangium sp. CA-139066 TaxID=3239930 RepID=UPI003D8B4931
MNVERSAGQRFAAALQELYEAAGRPEHRLLIRQAERQEPPVRLAPRSLSDWFGGRHLPADPGALRFLVTFLQPMAASHSSDFVPRNWSWWQHLHEQARQDTAGRAGRPRTGQTSTAADATRLGKPIGACSPFALEVHRAIEVPGQHETLPELPPYVPRAHDARLRSAVQAAAGGRSQLVVLVGESSTGKTRACWEAIQDLSDRWRLWHPIDPSRPLAAAEELDRVGPCTVVWLNEAQHYLLPANADLGERVSARLRTLITEPERGPVLVIGTMWPQYWATLMSPPTPGRPDPHAQARELLGGHDLPVPDAFNPADLTALQRVASTDVRLRHAFEHASAGRVTQHLAGVPELLQRYRNAPVTARAVIHVAIDARRFGGPVHLPRALLAFAAPGYMTDLEWNELDDDWLTDALAFTARPCHGTPGPLTRARPRPGPGPATGDGVYRLADHLEQTVAAARANVFPPHSFWDAFVMADIDPDTLCIVGEHAAARCRYNRAAQLFRRAADEGSALALVLLAMLHRQAGQPAVAEVFIRHAIDRGAVAGLWVAARWREQSGNRSAAENLARQAADRNATVGLRALAELRAGAGDVAAAETLYRDAAQRGDAVAWRALGDLARRSGDLDTAEELYREAVDRGDGVALRGLAEMRELAGDRPGAELIANRAADRGDTVGLRHVARMRERNGDPTGAEALYRRAAELGDTVALRSLARLRINIGDRTGAAELARRAADHGDGIGLRSLAEYHWRAGDRAAAVDLYERSADSGDTAAMRFLSRHCEQTGDLPGARSFALGAVNSGDRRALRYLAHLHELTGDRTGAKRIRRFGLNDDGSPADRFGDDHRPDAS